MTRVIFSAARYCAAISCRKLAQSGLALRCVIRVMRLPASGWTAMNTLHPPQRSYS